MLASTRYSINKITQSLQQRFIVFIHQYHYSATRLLIGTTNNIAESFLRTTIFFLISIYNFRFYYSSSLNPSCISLHPPISAALTIEKEIEVEMRAELYEFLLENKFKNGIMFKRSIELFVEHYNMEGTVKEDSLMRAFKRWRKAMKDNRKY